MTMPVLTESHAYRSFMASKYGSIKLTSYFQVYDEIFAPYVGKPITFVEVGVLNGGSLFMWREFFGPQARIIGVDLNPLAKKWEAHGFEIHIGSQADSAFWEGFFKRVGQIEVFLDDGGHFPDQQIITTLAAAPHIKDGGLLVVEDTHTSYLAEFHAPSKWSFVNFAKSVSDRVNARFPNTISSQSELSSSVYSVAFYESIVAFKIDRRRCFIPVVLSNGGESSAAKDFRKIDLKIRRGAVPLLLAKLARKTQRPAWLGCLIGQPINNFLNRRLKRYF
jgi:hypothetical protein